MIQTLADLQPIILVGLVIAMYSIEAFFPYLSKPQNKKQHDIHNFLISLVSFAINGLLGLVVLWTVNYTATHQLGLLNLIHLPPVPGIITGALLMDLGSYGVHRLTHKIPFLWRFHRIHHSDIGLNVSSSLRFHPLEVVLTQGIYVCTAIVVFGISMTGFILYGTLALIFVILQHTNVRFPAWLEKYGRYVFSTPGWHKIHHSDEQQYTDSHFGDVFTFWDRIFGTWHRIQPDEIHYGLKDFATPERQKIGFLFKSPFIKVSRNNPLEKNDVRSLHEQLQNQN